MAEGTNALLEVENLSVSFPVKAGVFLREVGEVKAVDQISFTLKEGETLGLVGESGCGKSTTGRAIINLIKYLSPDARIGGEVKFEGRNIIDLPRKQLMPYRSKIQMIFQDPYSSLNPRMTVGQMVEDPMKLHMSELSREDRKKRVVELLEKVGLSSEQANRYPHEFSGGQRQRVGIARALSTNPKVLIADEPVSALDVSIQAQVINLMKELQKDFGLTYIFIAHDLSVVKHISDRIAVMYLGQIVEIGSANQVYNNPQHPYTKALISAVPSMDPRSKSERQVLEGDVPSPMNKPSGCPFRTRCPSVQAICSEKRQNLREIETGHFIACDVEAKS